MDERNHPAILFGPGRPAKRHAFRSMALGTSHAGKNAAMDAGTFQLTFVLAVIFPMLRWIYVPMRLSMHFGILFTLNAPFIQWIVLYVVFIPWHAMFRRWFQKAASTQKVYS